MRSLFLIAFVCLHSILQAQTYYVRTDGSDSNVGDQNTPSRALRTIKHAATLVGPGSQVLVADGTYYEGEIIIDESGNSKSTPIVFKSINKHGAKIISNSLYHAFNLNNSVGVTIDGFDITFPSTTTSEYHGINVGGNWNTIRNCRIHRAAFSGIQGYLCDNLLIEYNEIFNNCKWTGNTVHENGSGISIYHPISRESNAGFHIIIRNNVLYDNAAYNNLSSTGHPTDGNGIIMDDFRCLQTWDAALTGGATYPHSSLIENNVVYNNGGRGIHVFQSNGVTIRNNTSYQNGDVIDQWVDPGDITVESGVSNVVVNNIAVSRDLQRGGALRIALDNSTTVVKNNIFCGPDIISMWSSSTVIDATNKQNSDPLYPKFISPSYAANANFRLQSTSPAINAGLASNAAALDFDGNSRVGTVDMGAFEYGGTSGNVAPSASISSPANGAAFTAPASITINATASDSDGTVTKVEFFNGATKLGEDTSSPYSYTWNSVAAGSYALTARATDDDGATTTSATVNITVNAPATVNATINSTPSAPAINGVKETVYGGPGYNVNNLVVGAVSGTTDLSGAWTALWDNTNLYIHLTVSDDVKQNDSGTSWWEDDVIEIFIDADNSKSTTYGSNDFQYTFRYNDATIRETKHNAITGVQFSMPASGTGYTFEVKIPWSTLTTTAAAGKKIGLDVQINDDDDGGARDGKKAWYATTDNTWQNPGLMATAELSATTTNAPPTTSISSPANGATFTAPANITINANASDTDGSIAKVEFFRGTTKLGEDTSSPYTFAWTSVAAGTYALTSVAHDNLGATTTSAVVNITVNPAVTYDGYVPNTTTAATINGTRESLYSGSTYNLDNVTVGTVSSSTDLSANWTAAWDNTNLYIHLAVTDEAKINDSGTNWWEDDVVEIFIDADNSNGGTYGANDFQYTFRYNDATIRETKHNAISGVQFSMPATSGGYNFEVKIPWSTLTTTASAGKLIGLDVQLNDDDNGGARDGKKAWHSTTDNTWQNPSLMGTVQLSAPVTGASLDGDRIVIENRNAREVSLYPNPVRQSELTVEFNEATTGKYAFVGMDGRTLSGDQFYEKHRIIIPETRSMPRGTYTLLIDRGTKGMIRRLIIVQ